MWRSSINLTFFQIDFGRCRLGFGGAWLMTWLNKGPKADFDGNDRSSVPFCLLCCAISVVVNPLRPEVCICRPQDVSCDRSVRSAGIAIKTPGIERSHFSASKLYPNFYFKTKKYFLRTKKKMKKCFFGKIFWKVKKVKIFNSIENFDFFHFSENFPKTYFHFFSISKKYFLVLKKKMGTASMQKSVIRLSYNYPCMCVNEKVFIRKWLIHHDSIVIIPNLIRNLIIWSLIIQLWFPSEVRAQRANVQLGTCSAGHYVLFSKGLLRLGRKGLTYGENLRPGETTNPHYVRGIIYSYV